MEEIVLLTLMATFTLVAALCSIVFNRMKLPPLIGYLVAGIIVANAFTITEDWHFVVSTLSSIGLVMLMFSIGMEIDISKVRTQGIFAIKIAAVQLPLLVIGGIAFGPMLGFNFVQSIALGAIISGSSTAVVLAVLKSQGKLDDEHIDLLVLITIMEDIGQVVILSMITPILAGSSMNVDSLIVMIVSILIFMCVSLIIGLKFMPRIVGWVSDNVSMEVLVIFAVGLAFGMALLSVKVGLSMAIGAFLMGMMISPCRSAHEITHQIEPMKNLFMAMFFISVGMEIKVDVIIQNIPLILVIYLIFAILKSGTVSLGYWLCASDGKTGFVSAISLVAMGEFAFIIAKEAYGYGVVSESFYTSVIGAALLSMIALPFLTRFSDRIWDSASEHMPRPLRVAGGAMNRFRDEIYAGINTSSKKSKDAYMRRMTSAYFNIILIAAIEIVFFWLIPPAVEWLHSVYGWERVYWEIALVVLNLFILMPPTARLITNTKFVMQLIMNSCSQIARARGESVSGKLYMSILKLNTVSVMLAIDFMIVFLVPNPLGIPEHLICFAVALFLLYLIYRNARKSNRDPSFLQGVEECGNAVDENDGE